MIGIVCEILSEEKFKLVFQFLVHMIVKDLKNSKWRQFEIFFSIVPSYVGIHR